MDDIAQQLAMDAPERYRGTFFRPNLHLHAQRKGEGVKLRDAIAALVQWRAGQSGIVYCQSRRSVEATAELLAARGVRARPYHAGLETETRTAAHEAFRRGDVDVIVATIAFGMGIDKPDIRFVIHRDMPGSIEAYYQEIGRAGRDGEPSDCVLFYSWADVMSHDRFAADSEPEVAARSRRQVRQMFDLADREHCRHRALVRHFEERIADCASSCAVCLGSDILADARAAARSPRSAAPAWTGAGASGATGTASVSREDDPVAQGLFEQLRALRKELADASGVPAYIVFSDAALRDMARRRPLTRAEMLAVSGVGPVKLERYGDPFLALLRAAAEVA
jgi:ATP-dependent DNA helicase RecQ